ncbi:hypothetical protein, partial [Halorubrum sp. Ea8]|uniref:hypothetical protein n=1 Tax=Halorubrum sp. Ea8 TaxID=1383841 RepID=UPI001C3E70B2
DGDRDDGAVHVPTEFVVRVGSPRPTTGPRLLGIVAIVGIGAARTLTVGPTPPTVLVVNRVRRFSVGLNRLTAGVTAGNRLQ